MSRKYVTGKRYYRIVPCPSYEITKLEAWLSELAESGLFLTEDGIFAGIASFECKEPRKANYRLEAAQKSTGMWADNGGDPEPEQIELSEKYSWEYVAKLKDFHIYRSLEPGARELNTDPEVQAMALEAVKKRARDSLISSFLLLFVYPLVLTRGCILLTAISMGVGWMLLALALGVLTVGGGIRAFAHLKKLQRSLKREGCFGSDTDWKKERIRYFSRRIITAGIGIVLICTVLRAWGISALDENKIPLEEYGGTIPFATIRDFAGEGYSDYSLTMAGLFGGINSVEEKTGWFAPRCIDYNEHAEVKKADGQCVDGGLYVEYCELRTPGLAERCAEEFYRLDRLSRLRERIEPLEAPELNADSVVAYRNGVHFPTVIFRKGCTVVKAYFFQTASDGALTLEEWAEILCESIP